MTVIRLAKGQIINKSTHSLDKPKHSPSSVSQLRMDKLPGFSLAVVGREICHGERVLEEEKVEVIVSYLLLTRITSVFLIILVRE